MTAPDLIPAELLEKGAAYIEEHGLWQGAFWPRAGVFSVEDAVRQGLPACAWGALRIAGQDRYTLPALHALADHIDGHVPTWSDADGRTAAEVADAMRACATGLRGA